MIGNLDEFIWATVVSALTVSAYRSAYDYEALHALPLLKGCGVHFVLEVATILPEGRVQLALQLVLVL